MLKYYAIYRNYIFLVSGVILLGAIIIVATIWLSVEDSSIPSWRGITPGQTTQPEVIAILGQPDNIIECEKWGWGLENPFDSVWGVLIRPCMFGSLTYEYHERWAPDKAPGVHQIHFRDGIVWLVIEDTWAYLRDDRFKNEKIVATYGWPRSEAWSRGYLRRHLLYCDNVFYFTPVGICPEEFDFYLTTDPPPSSKY